MRDVERSTNGLWIRIPFDLSCGCPSEDFDPLFRGKAALNLLRDALSEIGFVAGGRQIVEGKHRQRNILARAQGPDRPNSGRGRNQQYSSAGEDSRALREVCWVLSTTDAPRTEKQERHRRKEADDHGEDYGAKDPVREIKRRTHGRGDLD